MRFFSYRERRIIYLKKEEKEKEAEMKKRIATPPYVRGWYFDEEKAEGRYKDCEHVELRFEL